MAMSDVLRTPERRVCERCGRTERHGEESGGWQVVTDGDLYCIHEWDIDGDFVPVQGATGVATVKEC
jgi:hypothetical protein